MTIEELLETRESPVVTIDPAATLAEAARRMIDHRIGALVVADGHDRLVGVISERDLMRSIVDYGNHLVDRRVDEVMTRRVATCAPDDSLVEALHLMAARHIRHLPVVDGGTLIGMISIRDVTGEWLNLLEHENQALRDDAGAHLRPTVS